MDILFLLDEMGFELVKELRHSLKFSDGKRNVYVHGFDRWSVMDISGDPNSMIMGSGPYNLKIAVERG